MKNKFTLQIFIHWNFSSKFDLRQKKMLPSILILSIFSFDLINSIRFRSTRQTNGCGPETINIDRFLENIGEDVLISCCHQHDLCYDTCGTKQLTCDENFLNCMLKSCEQLISSLTVSKCQNHARLLFWIVFWTGQSAYDQAQSNQLCSRITTVTMLQSNNLIKPTTIQID